MTAEATLPAAEPRAFVVLADGSTLPPLADLAPLVDAVGSAVERPYRAEAVERGGGRWAVGAVRTRVESMRGLDGAEVELVVRGATWTLHVDGRPLFAAVEALERVADEAGGDVLVRARRLDGPLWEVETTRL